MFGSNWTLFLKLVFGVFKVLSYNDQTTSTNYVLHARFKFHHFIFVVPFRKYILSCYLLCFCCDALVAVLRIKYLQTLFIKNTVKASVFENTRTLKPNFYSRKSSFKLLWHDAIIQAD